MPFLIVRDDAVKVNAQAVINPIYSGGENKENELIHNAYEDALFLALKSKYSCIVLPLISPENCNYSRYEVLKAATNAIRDFLEDNEMMVYLTVSDKEPLQADDSLAVSIKKYIDNNYAKEETAEDGICEEIRIGGQKPDKPIKAVRHEKTSFLMRNTFRASMCASNSADEVSFEAKVAKRSLDNLVKQLDETFSERLLRLIDERGLKDSQVYNRANIDRRHFSKIRNDKNYVPTKKTVLSFAVALELSADESVDLLKSAGYAFSNSSMSDVIIRYFIESGQYDIYRINEALFEYDQPLLGA